ALIDDKCLAEPISVDLVGAEQVNKFDVATLRPFEGGFDVPARFARHESEIETSDTRGGRVQHAEAVPAGIWLDRSHDKRRLRGERKHSATICTRKRRQPNEHEGTLRVLDLVKERMRSACDFRQGLGAGAQSLIRVSQVGLPTDESDGKAPLRLPPALPNARVEDRSFEPRIGADEQDG